MAWLVHSVVRNFVVDVTWHGLAGLLLLHCGKTHISLTGMHGTHGHE